MFSARFAVETLKSFVGGFKDVRDAHRRLAQVVCLESDKAVVPDGDGGVFFSQSLHDDAGNHFEFSAGMNADGSYGFIVGVRAFDKKVLAGLMDLAASGVAAIDTLSLQEDWAGVNENSLHRSPPPLLLTFNPKGI